MNWSQMWELHRTKTKHTQNYLYKNQIVYIVWRDACRHHSSYFGCVAPFFQNCQYPFFFTYCVKLNVHEMVSSSTNTASSVCVVTKVSASDLSFHKKPNWVFRCRFAALPTVVGDVVIPNPQTLYDKHLCVHRSN